MDIRCESKKHGELEGDVLEVKCNSRFCGAGSGVIVLHKFSLSSGRLIETKRFQDPLQRKEKPNGSRSGISVRSA